MRVFLSYPPSANARLTIAKGRRDFVSTERYRVWKGYAAWIVSLAVRDSGSISGPYSLGMVACPPDRRGRDLDNLIKATSDALKDGGAIEDDSLCQRLTIEWGLLDESGILCEVQPCPLLISPEAGKSKSPSAKPKPPTRRRSPRAATTQAAGIGGPSATEPLGLPASASPPSSIPAPSTGSKKPRRRTPKKGLATPDKQS